MKKVLIAAVALMMGASLSLAGLGVQWANGGWMAQYGGDVNDGPGIAENNSVIWQLIFSSDNVANEPNLANEHYVSGDDQWLAEREVPVSAGTASDGTAWDEWLQQAEGGSDPLYETDSWSSLGYVYQRLWQGTPSADKDSYYFDSALTEITEKDLAYAIGAGSAPLVSNFDKDGNGVVVDKVLPGTGPGPEPPTPVIPEPATMSLLGLGALAMVLRRKLSK